VPVAQLWLKISRSLQVALLPRWVSISFVIACGPGDFFAFSCLSAACISFNVSFLTMYSFVVGVSSFPFAPFVLHVVVAWWLGCYLLLDNCQQIFFAVWLPDRSWPTASSVALSDSITWYHFSPGVMLFVSPAFSPGL